MTQENNVVVIDGDEQSSFVLNLAAVLQDLSSDKPELKLILDDLLTAQPGSSSWADLAAQLIQYAANTPYHDIGDYMGRTWVRTEEDRNVYSARVHEVKRSDSDRALHDHPWGNMSLVLSGGYWEVLPGQFQAASEKMRFGVSCYERFLPKDASTLSWLFREVQLLNTMIRSSGAKDLPKRRIDRLNEMGVFWRGPGDVVFRKATSLHRLIIPYGGSAWSLFAMNKRERVWGFQTTEGWKSSDEYLSKLGRVI